MFNRGQTAVALHLDGKRAIRAHLNGQVVWDGTRSVVMAVPVAMAMVTALVPGIHADSSTPAPLITATATAFAPSASASSNVHPDTRIQVTATAFAPSAMSTATVVTPLIMAEAVMLAPHVSEAFDRSIDVPRINVTATAFAPSITGHYSAQVPLMVGSAEVLTPMITATGAAAVNVPLIAANVTAFAPSVTSTVAIAAPLMSATATAFVPELRRDAKITAPLITATATAFVPDVQAINFQPQGMNLTSIFVFKTTTPVIATPMAARAALPTSVVTANKLIMQNPGPVRAAWIATIETYSGDTVGLSVWNNGTLITAAPLIANPPFRRTAKISGQSTGFTVAQGDALELRVRAGQASFDQQLNSPDVQLNIYKSDQLPAVASRTTDQASMTTWADLIPSAVPADAVMDGNAFVAQFSHPEMLLAADLTITSAQATAVRILVNGIDVGITGTAGANDGRLTAAGRANIVAGDRILVQSQRTGTTGTMVVKTGSTWGIV